MPKRTGRFHRIAAVVGCLLILSTSSTAGELAIEIFPAQGDIPSSLIVTMDVLTAIDIARNTLKSRGMDPLAYKKIGFQLQNELVIVSFMGSFSLPSYEVRLNRVTLAVDSVGKAI
jgi:hypothetical protein